MLITNVDTGLVHSEYLIFPEIAPVFEVAKSRERSGVLLPDFKGLSHFFWVNFEKKIDKHMAAYLLFR